MAWYRVFVVVPVYLVLMAVGLWQRLWDSLYSILQPVLGLYDSIDTDNLTCRSIIDQFVKGVLSMWQVVWCMGHAVVELTTKPFKNCLQQVARHIEDLKQEHEKLQPRE